MQRVDAAVREAGAVVDESGTTFRVWAPGSVRVEVVIRNAAGETARALDECGDGWFEATFADVRAGTRYCLRLDGGEMYPDPLSRFQPDGVHGPSQVVDPSGFDWTDADWAGCRLDELIIYEVHVGTATTEGTFDGLVERLPHLRALGVTAVELMPVAEFAGARNWGYDGVYPFAPSHAYGGPEALRRFVDAAHKQGLGVILDVVYNHFGPEGNYLPAVTRGRIFTERHHTPWGTAVNYDDEGCEAVRSIIVDNVRQWIRDYHLDGLRLDAAHAIVDASTPHILQEIAETAHAARRGVIVIAEDERNERTLLLPPEEGGFGLDAVWADDVHHILRRLVAGDSEGYYAGYEGTPAELARAIRQGWLYQGEHYTPTDEPRGTSSEGIPPQRFVYCIQNHDQVGNRALGERLNHQVEPGVYRAISALLLLSPGTPLLWMGQDWAASTPFLYFTDHPDELGRLVTEGRREEFSGFSEFADEGRELIPDPQAQETFDRSRLDWSEVEREPHAAVLRLYRELLRIRRDAPAMRSRGRESWDAQPLSDGALGLRRDGADGTLLVIVNLAGSLEVDLRATPLARPATRSWRVRLCTEEERFGGAGAEAVGLDGARLLVTRPCAVLLEA
jgi:maltooligosyltrehalose trehalohydrolase